MKVLKDVAKESVEGLAEESVNPKSVLFTDKNTAFVNLKKLVMYHIKIKSSADFSKGDLIG
jgi:hypothetical protein